ncbi:hypothetical protein BDZ97DRAFT_1808256 [Flammula alnicola]|nr:hypothetical protein BDZ97DRAFT_1808256 [Flammula alnicola]
MPRIRKETSNRKSTNDRAKRRKQVKESRRKKVKAAKKSVQWKSKTPKDPGIPSEFPYKDQILAEVAEERRIAAEEKERKKEEKQRALAKARAIARGEPVEDSDAEANDAEARGGEDDEEEEEGKPTNSKDLNVGAESIASLSAKIVNAHLKPRPKPVSEVVEEEEEEEEEVPVLINRDLPNLKTVLEKADVVVEVLDGRDPMAFRSQHVEELAKEMGKRVLFVVNKIDTCPREALAQWSTQLRRQHPTLLFRSAASFLPEKPVQVQPQVKKGKGKAPKIPLDDAVGADSIIACLAHWAKEKKGDQPLTVAVVGVTNVGKSSIINSLLKRSALPVYTLASSSRGPTTTELPQEVELEIENQKILIIDTPGLSFRSNEEEDASIPEERRARDILLRSKGRIDRLKDPNPPIAHIISRANTEDLMLLYSLPAFVKGDPTAFLSGVARANQLVKKKGELDLTGAARIVLRDWSVGKLAHYTTPPANSMTSAEPSNSNPDTLLTQLYAKDEAILAAIPTRKERRKSGGLVKLSPSSADERKAAVEEDWAALQHAEDEESDDDGDESEDGDVQGMDVDYQEKEEDEEEEEAEEEDLDEEADGSDEEDEEEEAAPAPLSNKQKRKRPFVTSQPERPAKKVAFAPPPAKHSRSGPKPVADNAANGKQRSIKTAQQKPLKPVQTSAKKLESKRQEKPVSVKTAAKTKSDLTIGSAGSGAMKKPSPSENNGKVANKPSTAKAKGALAPDGKKDGNGQEAYDFGKFF